MPFAWARTARSGRALMLTLVGETVLFRFGTSVASGFVGPQSLTFGDLAVEILDPSANREGRDEIWVLSEQTPPQEIYEVFCQLSIGELPAGVRAPDYADEPIAEVGRFDPSYQPCIQDFGSEFVEYFGGLNQRMHELATNLIELHRWLVAIDPVSLDVPRALGFCFSVNGADWFEIPSRGTVSTSLGLAGSPIRADEKGLLRDLLGQDIGRPLAHALLEEARSLPPRPKLVMIIASAEIGTKQFLSWAVPQSEWLVTNLPSPPLPELLSKVVPEAWSAGKSDLKSFAIPKRLIASVRRGVGERNRVAHRGSVTIDGKLADTLAVDVRELLYLFDRFMGHGWAEAHLTASTLETIRNS